MLEPFLIRQPPCDRRFRIGAEYFFVALSIPDEDGFDILVEYAALVPFAGFDNPAQGLKARPAQLARVRLAWRF